METSRESERSDDERRRRHDDDRSGAKLHNGPRSRRRTDRSAATIWRRRRCGRNVARCDQIGDVDDWSEIDEVDGPEANDNKRGGGRGRPKGGCDLIGGADPESGR